jgi:hypothetical protein
MDITGVKFIKRVYLSSHSADPSPPLGTILGNIGAMLLLFVYLLIIKLLIYLLIFR